MPRMDGIELCRRLNGMESRMQMVVVSGYGDFDYAQQCMSFGVKEYLLKPVSREQVYHVLEKLAACRRREDQGSYLSITRVEEVAEQLEEAVWSLHRNMLAELLDGWESELMTYDWKPKQLEDLLGDLFRLLLKRLNARDVYPFEGKEVFGQGAGKEEGFPVFREAVLELLSILGAKRKGQAKDPVEEAKRYIESHLAQEASLEEVAEMLGLNSSYFSQLFKQSTGETFVQYRIRRRMEKAKKLLQLPHYRITDITYEVGYSDHPHFTKTFKKYTGLSPSDYRQSLGMNG
ncbi:helix-turn-helix domain-containing protein [Paenibacillus sp. CC-CFT747]|nr:helix-turn-helix domain-containing protein [Paenibacillus sp. CC-CFT747]